MLFWQWGATPEKIWTHPRCICRLRTGHRGSEVAVEVAVATAQLRQWSALSPSPYHPAPRPRTPAASAPRRSASPATRQSGGGSSQSATASSWTRKWTWTTPLATAPVVRHRTLPVNSHFLSGETEMDRLLGRKGWSPGYRTVLALAGFTCALTRRRTSPPVLVLVPATAIPPKFHSLHTNGPDGFQSGRGQWIQRTTGGGAEEPRSTLWRPDPGARSSTSPRPHYLTPTTSPRPPRSRASPPPAGISTWRRCLALRAAAAAPPCPLHATAFPPGICSSSSKLRASSTDKGECKWPHAGSNIYF